jgi:hypothetical protein
MVIEGPLPARLDIEMLRELRIAAYAIIQALEAHSMNPCPSSAA